MLVLVSLFSMVALGQCAMYTVTEEVWLDVEIKDFDGQGEDFRGRIIIALFGETCPMTTMNFASLAKGHKIHNENLSYKGSPFHRIIQDFLIQGGDFTSGDGSGGKSIYGHRFIDENHALSHLNAGWVSMANHGKDTNGSQFFILLNKARWLDGTHVVFGKVIHGMDVVKTIGNLETDRGTAVPDKQVKIVDSGLVGLTQKYDLTEEEASSPNDLKRKNPEKESK